MNLNINLKDVLNISNLKNQKGLIFVILVVLVASFFGKKIWESQKAQLSRVNNEISVCEKKISLSEDINLLFSKFEELKKIGWLTEESAAIMSIINNIANKHNLEISNFNPLGLNNRDYYSVFSMGLNFRSNYFSLVSFLSELEQLNTLTKIVSIQINPERGSGDEDDPMVRVDLTIDAFIAKN